MNLNRKLYIVPDGGLGNRLRSIASGIWLARDASMEPVIVWHSNPMCQSRLDDILDISVIPAQIFYPRRITFHCQYEIPRKQNLWLPKLLVPRRFSASYYDDFNLMEYCDDAPRLLREVTKSSGDILFFSGQEFYDFPREFFREIIRFNQQIIEKAHMILSGSEPKITLQIRRTDHLAAIANSPEGAFRQIMEEQHPSECFFLASDDEEVKTRFRTHFGKRVITNHSKARRDTPEGIMDAMAEIWIMAQTNIIYGSVGSSFPDIASWLGNVKLYRVISQHK